MVRRENTYFLLFEENRAILDILEVIPHANIFTISTRSISAFVSSACSAMIRLRRLNIDAAVDMEFFARGSAILSFLSGAKWRVGFHAFFGSGPYRGDLMTHRLLYNSHLHTSEVFRLLVDVVNESAEDLPALRWPPSIVPSEPPQFTPSAEELAKVRRMLGCEAGAWPRIVLLNPNAGDLLPLRRWPSERYLQLARRLIDTYPDVLVVFTGAGAEARAVASLANQVGSIRCRCVAGETSMRELLALYCSSQVLVTNDSGPAHFASLTPIKVIALFGPETPALFAPRSRRTVALWAGLPCSPCVNAYNNRQTPCRNNLCMQALSLDQVFSSTCAAFETSEPEPAAVQSGATIALNTR